MLLDRLGCVYHVTIRHYPCLQISQQGVWLWGKTSSKSFISTTMGSGVSSSPTPIQFKAVWSDRKVGRSGEVTASSYLSLWTVLYSVAMETAESSRSRDDLRKVKHKFFSLEQIVEEKKAEESGVTRGGGGGLDPVIH